MRKFYWIVWPSFLVAVIAEVVFFAFINPRELYLLGEPVRLSAIATYSIGFFLFWAVCLATSAATRFFQRSPEDLNRAAARKAN